MPSSPRVSSSKSNSDDDWDTLIPSAQPNGDAYAQKRYREQKVERDSALFRKEKKAAAALASTMKKRPRLAMTPGPKSVKRARFATRSASPDFMEASSPLMASVAAPVMSSAAAPVMARVLQMSPPALESDADRRFRLAMNEFTENCYGTPPRSPVAAAAVAMAPLPLTRARKTKTKKTKRRKTHTKDHKGKYGHRRRKF
jgi:hypothetical protein